MGTVGASGVWDGDGAVIINGERGRLCPAVCKHCPNFQRGGSCPFLVLVCQQWVFLPFWLPFLPSKQCECHCAAPCYLHCVLAAVIVRWEKSPGLQGACSLRDLLQTWAGLGREMGKLLLRHFSPPGAGCRCLCSSLGVCRGLGLAPGWAAEEDDEEEEEEDNVCVCASAPTEGSLMSKQGLKAMR